MPIKTKLDAITVINAAIQSHSSTWEMAKTTEDYVINMAPPFDEAVLKDKANWSANWNFGKGRASAEQIITKNSTEITKAIALCDILFENYDAKKDTDPVHEFLTVEEMRADFAERIGSAFSESVLEKTQRIDTLIKRSEYECTLFGYASFLKDYNSIFPNVIPYRSIAFEDHTDIDSIGTFVVFDCIKGSYLYNIYTSIKRDTSSDEVFTYGASGAEQCPVFSSSGWNEHALCQIICDIYNTNDTALGSINPKGKDAEKGWTKKYVTWEDVNLLSEKMGDYWCALNMNNIHIAKVFEIEDDGTVYENYCALNEYIGNSVSMVSLKADILFHKKRPSLKQGEIINIVRDVTIDGTVYIHDIKGSGKIIGESALRYDILRNGIQDKLMLSGSPWVYSPTGLIDNNMQVKVIGGLVVLGQGTEVVPNMIKQDLSDHISALRIEQGEQEANMSHIKPNVNLSNRPTKDEVNFINSEALSTRMSDVPQKLKSYSSIITIIFKALFSDRILNKRDQDVKDSFMKHLKQEFSDLTLTDDDLVKILKCVSTIQVSPVMSDREAISSALNVASTATARQRLTRMFLATFGFSRSQIRNIMEVESYGRDAELAAIENSMFENTREVVFGLGQDPITHLQAHFYKVDQKFAGLQSGEDPVRAHLYVTNALTNTRLHVDAIAKSPFYKNQAKDYIKTQKYFEKKLQELASELDTARQKMQQQQQQEGQQQGGEPKLDPETQAKFYLDRIKLMEKINSSRARTQVMQDMRQQSFELEQELKKKRVDADIENRKQKTQVDIDSSLAKKSVEMVK